MLANRPHDVPQSIEAPATDSAPVCKRRRTGTLLASGTKPTRSKYKSTRILYPLITLLLILAQAANLVRGGRNVDAEARAVLASLPPETTLQGIRNARDTILWRLEASAFELKTVLDEREATQRALAWLDRQLDEFDKAAEEDTGSVGDWGVGGGVGKGEGDDENKEGEEEEVVDELDE